MLGADDDNYASKGFLHSGNGSGSGRTKDTSCDNLNVERWQSVSSRSTPSSIQPLEPPQLSSIATPQPASASDILTERDDLPLLSRSPGSYQHRNAGLLHAADHISSLSRAQNSFPGHMPPQTANQSSTTFIPTPASAMSLSSVVSDYFSKDSVPGSDSGTEADDEHFLKGLPAPRSRPHKGLRGMSEEFSGASTPLRRTLSPERSDGCNKHENCTRERCETCASGGDSEILDANFHYSPERERYQNAIDTRKRHSTGSTAALPSAFFRRPKRDLEGDVAVFGDSFGIPGRSIFDRSRQRREIVRRLTEFFLLVILAALVFSKPMVQSLAGFWSRELRASAILVSISLLIFPWRLADQVSKCDVDDHGFIPYIRRRLVALRSLRIPASFDPAPLLYPFALPILVSFLLVGPTLQAAPIINIILSLCTLPRALFPLDVPLCDAYNTTQWLATLIPMSIAVRGSSQPKMLVLNHIFHRGPASPQIPSLILESSALLYPLHVSLCNVLRDLTTTSLLPAELQLLSVALTNLLLLASSAQMIILKALLWIGGIGLLLFGGHTVRWGITLARIPRWRFRRIELDTANKRAITSLWVYLSPAFLLKCVQAELKSLRHARLEVMYGLGGDREVLDDSDGGSNSPTRVSGSERKRRERAYSAAAAPATAPNFGEEGFPGPDVALQTGTLSLKRVLKGHRTLHTPSGRKKHATSPTVRAFFSLTYKQAVRRKWLYAGYLYVCIALLVFAGIRPYVSSHALHGREPFGWALGYLFGDVDWMRLEVVKNNLESWVCLPARTATASCHNGGPGWSHGPIAAVQDTRLCPSCGAGWVELNRQLWFGAGWTRLLLAGYWIIVLIFGLAIVFTLSPVYEVDTRRKVFHFMMVGMLLPATFVDPTYTALALSLVLAVFILLEVLRASQLPPLSRPIATFLTPYVDGRDLRGPVVISHIFLLIGCAIPLWMSLAALPRAPLAVLMDTSADNAKCTDGWEVPSRDISMVAGVVCVGLGDAAASLIGRRWGRRKWVWGGGKSLEGSAAFAIVVFLGLMLANAWLRIGGWPTKGQENLPHLADVGEQLTRPRSFALGRSMTPLISFLATKLPPFLQRTMAWLGTTAARSVAPRAAICASLASMTEAVLTGGNDNVVVPVILWTCVKSFEL
ncbi:dolichol kinase [Sporothrix epigloea]|uniref:dolichol kinase n=1 Tax=Sporothrix epigloea TaxID=1892477 RepID=A0ABP0D7W1_9PEZI